MNPNQNSQPQWTQVAGGGSNNERWAPQKELNYNPQDPKNQIIGYLKDISERPGNNGPFNVAEIATVDPNTGALGACIDVAGGKVLDDMLDKITLGTFICIKFTGKARSKTGNTYNTWEVFQDSNAIPFSQLGGHVKAATNGPPAPVFNNNAQSSPAPQFQQQTSQPNFQQQGNGQPVFNQNTAAAPTFQQQGQPVFNAPPVFNQQAPQFNNGTQRQSQPPAQQQPYVPPVQSGTTTVPQFTPNAQAPQFNPNVNQGTNQAPQSTFGGQPLPPNPFAQPNDQLPY